MEIDSRPEEIDDAERVVRRLEIEEMALSQETDEASANASPSCVPNWRTSVRSSAGLTARWENEKRLHRRGPPQGGTGSAEDRVGDRRARR